MFIQYCGNSIQIGEMQYQAYAAVHTQQLSERDHATWFTVNFDEDKIQE